MRRRDLFGLLAAGVVEAGVSKQRLTVIADEAGASPEEWIAFARRHGLSHLEMRGIRLNGEGFLMESLAPEQLKPVAAKLRDAGLKVSFFNSALLKFTLPGTTAVSTEEFYENYYRKRGWTAQAMFDQREELLKRSIAAAQTMGAKSMRTFSFWRVAQPETIRSRLVDVLAGMAETARREGMDLLVETEGSTNIATSREARAVLDLTPAKNVGLNWDPQNSLKLEPDVFPAGYEKLPKKRIRNVQLKQEGLFGDAGGQGKLDWAGIIARLERDGYRGFYGLETHVGTGSEKYENSNRCMVEMQRIAGSIGKGARHT